MKKFLTLFVLVSVALSILAFDTVNNSVGEMLINRYGSAAMSGNLKYDFTTKRFLMIDPASNDTMWMSVDTINAGDAVSFLTSVLHISGQLDVDTIYRSSSPTDTIFFLNPINATISGTITDAVYADTATFAWNSDSLNGHPLTYFTDSLFNYLKNTNDTFAILKGDTLYLSRGYIGYIANDLGDTVTIDDKLKVTDTIYGTITHAITADTALFAWNSDSLGGHPLTYFTDSLNNYLNNVNDTFGILTGDSINITSGYAHRFYVDSLWATVAIEETLVAVKDTTHMLYADSIIVNNNISTPNLESDTIDIQYMYNSNGTHITILEGDTLIGVITKADTADYALNSDSLGGLYWESYLRSDVQDTFTYILGDSIETNIAIADTFKGVFQEIRPELVSIQPFTEMKYTPQDASKPAYIVADAAAIELGYMYWDSLPTTSADECNLTYNTPQLGYVDSLYKIFDDDSLLVLKLLIPDTDTASVSVLLSLTYIDTKDNIKKTLFTDYTINDFSAMYDGLGGVDSYKVVPRSVITDSTGVYNDKFGKLVLTMKVYSDDATEGKQFKLYKTDLKLQ